MIVYLPKGNNVFNALSTVTSDGKIIIVYLGFILFCFYSKLLKMG